MHKDMSKRRIPQAWLVIALISGWSLSTGGHHFASDGSSVSANTECVVISADYALQDKNTDLILRGRVVDIVRSSEIKTGYRVTLAVDRVWKGSAAERFHLFVSELAEGVPRFEAGSQHVVLAKRLDPRIRQQLGLADGNRTDYTATGCSAFLSPDFEGSLGRGYAPTAAVAAAQSPARETPDFVLDPTPRILGRRAPTTGVPSVVWSSTSHPAVDPTLRVTLVGMSPLTLAPGDPVVFEVMIENTGGSTVLLPWADEVEWSPLDPQADFVQAIIGVYAGAKDGSKRLSYTPGRLLHRRKSLVASAQPLSPGEKALVRVQTVFRPSSEELERILAQAGGAVEWIPLVGLSDRASATYSVNAIEGRVVPRAR